MRFLLLFGLVLFGLSNAASAAECSRTFTGSGTLDWEATYYQKPEPACVIPAVIADFAAQSKEGISSYMSAGFLAGIMYANPSQAEGILDYLLSHVTTQKEMLVVAVHFSSVPNREALLDKIAMLEKNKDKDLANLALEYKANKVTIYTLSPGEEKQVSNVLFIGGYFGATGDAKPFKTIVNMLGIEPKLDQPSVAVLAFTYLYKLAVKDPKLVAFLQQEDAQRSGDIKEKLDYILAHGTKGEPLDKSLKWFKAPLSLLQPKDIDHENSFVFYIAVQKLRADHVGA